MNSTCVKLTQYFTGFQVYMLLVVNNHPATMEWKYYSILITIFSCDFQSKKIECRRMGKKQKTKNKRRKKKKGDLRGELNRKLTKFMLSFSIALRFSLHETHSVNKICEREFSEPLHKIYAYGKAAK